MAEDFKSLIKEQKETNKRLDVLVEATGEQAVETGAAATESRNEETARGNKTTNLLKSMAKSFSNFGKSFAMATKARLKGLSGGLLKFLKATALAGLLVAALAFLESQTWKDMKKFIVEDVIPALVNFYKNTLRPFFSGIITFIKDPTWQNFKDIFDVDNPLGLVLGLAGITVLLAPGLLFAGLTLGVIAFKAAATLAGKGLSGLSKKLGVKPAKVGKAFLKAARFLGPVGLAVAAGVTLFDGFSAGIKEFKESGNFGAAVREGAAGALSSLTFGLVSQETISGAFTAIGDKFITLGDGIKNAIPTKEELKESFTKLKDNLSPLKDIKLPEEVSFSAIKDSVDTMATALNDSFANLTGIDVNEKLKNIGTAVGNKVSDLASSFENITGITIPSFGDIGAKLKSILPSIGNPFSAIMDSINSSAFFKDADSNASVLSNPILKIKGILKDAFASIFGSSEQSIENRPGARAMGGPVTKGKKYNTHFGDGELFIPNSSGMILSAKRTEQIMQAGISRGMQGMGSGGPAIVNAPVNTVNNSQSNMTSTSTPMFHPSPLLGAVNVAA